MAAITEPSLLRKITPIPEQFSSAKTAPSKLILKISNGGGFQRILLHGRLEGGGGKMAWNSEYLSAANWERWFTEQHGCWEHTWFLWVQMVHTVKAKRAGFRWCSNTQAINSLKLEKEVWFRKLHAVSLSHTQSRFLQVHTAWIMSSASPRQRSQVWSVIIVLRRRLLFDGSESRQALQTRFFTLFGHARAQICFHRPFSWSGRASLWEPSSASFKNLLGLNWPYFINNVSLFYTFDWVKGCGVQKKKLDKNERPSGDQVAKLVFESLKNIDVEVLRSKRFSCYSIE